MMPHHPPSAARAVIRDARRGVPFTQLRDNARAVRDPYHAALALLAVSEHRDAASGEARDMAAEALHLSARVPREWRRAELLAELAKRLARWRQPDEREPLWVALHDEMAALPTGEPLVQALEGAARYFPAGAQAELLELALGNAGHEVASAKPVLRAATTVLDAAATAARLRALPPGPAVRLLGYLHLQLRRTNRLPEPTPLALALKRGGGLPELRYLATLAADTGELRALHGAAQGLDDNARARLLATLGGRAHRVEEPRLALALLLEALEATESIADSRARDRVRRNIAKGLARLGEEELARDIEAVGEPSGDPRAAEAATPPEPEASEAPVPQGRGAHTLALWNTYSGKLKPPHLRAIARAAALCHGFDLDLALVDFPADNLAPLCAAVERDSEAAGARSLAPLTAAGRVRLVAPMREGALATADRDWCGEPVATTAHPEPAKRAALDELARGERLCLLMGLGPSGLPQRALRDATHHLELTGRDVSLETATAMGVIAARLGALEG